MPQVLLGPAPPNPLVDTLQQAGAAGDWAALAQHCAASGVLGPLWEEVRGTSLGPRHSRGGAQLGGWALT